MIVLRVDMQKYMLCIVDLSESSTRLMSFYDINGGYKQKNAKSNTKVWRIKVIDTKEDHVTK